MKKVKIDPVAFAELSETEWQAFLSAAEVDIEHELELLKDSVEKKYSKLLETIDKKKSLLATIPGKDPYYKTVKHTIGKFRMRKNYLVDIKYKIKSMLETYKELTELYSLNKSQKEKIKNELAKDAEQKLVEDYEAEMYAGQAEIEWKDFADVLQYMKQQFLILLHETILYTRQKQNEEETLIIQMLSNNLACIELYELINKH